MQRFLYILLILFIHSSAFASSWRFDITPYAWFLNMNGRTSVGTVTAHVNETFSDLVSSLDFAGMLFATAHYDDFGLYFNGLYASTSDGGTANGIHVSVNNQYGIYGAGLSYIILNKIYANSSVLRVEPYAGFRHTVNNTSITAATIRASKDVNWTDPVIGVRLDYLFNTQWSAQFIGDIGGTNASTHYSYSAGAFAGYRPASWQSTTIYAGYRVLDQRYQTGSGSSFYDWNMKLFGPLLGITFGF